MHRFRYKFRPFTIKEMNRQHAAKHFQGPITDDTIRDMSPDQIYARVKNLPDGEIDSFYGKLNPLSRRKVFRALKEKRKDETFARFLINLSDPHRNNAIEKILNDYYHKQIVNSIKGDEEFSLFFNTITEYNQNLMINSFDEYTEALFLRKMGPAGQSYIKRAASVAAKGAQSKPIKNERAF